MKILKNRAFTLAEVLITLGIIGVVAAMTIPTLLSNLRAKRLETEFKKAYADLNVAARAFYADNDMSFRDYQIETGEGKSNSTDSLKYFITYLKGDTMKKYSPKGFDNQMGIKSYNLNNQVTTQYPCNQSIIVRDPIGRTYSLDDSAASFNFSIGPKICVDINGVDRPNKWGVDKFIFVFNSDNSVIPYTGKNWEWISPQQSDEKIIAQYCSTSTTTPVHTCSYFALKNKSPDGKGDYWHDFLKGK